MSATEVRVATDVEMPPRGHARRTLLIAGIAHALHDGFTDLIYILLPVWQAEFGLGYAALALLRGIYAGAMAGLQIPSVQVAKCFGGRTVLAVGTGFAALGYLLAGCSGGLLALCAALALAGAGSSTQHPIASGAVSRAYGEAARGPLSTYNFSGDLGKAAIPAAVGVLLTLMPWRLSLWLLGAIGLVVAAGIAWLLPSEVKAPSGRTPRPAGGGRGGFRLLFALGMLDTSVRMGLLTFLPFLLKAKGATLPTVGVALAFVFIGGAGGKFACGWIGERVGVLWTVLLTEGATVAGILVVMTVPLFPTLVLLPLLGVVLNGTSSVLYGTVPELVTSDQTEHAFAQFYTGTIGAGAIAPVLYGLLGDAVGINWATAATALTALATFPLAFAIAPLLDTR